VVIACLGLLGMAMYSTERRLKELGVRKVLGAGASSLVYMLSKSFIKLLVLAVVIAAPLSYFANNFWLQELSNSVDFGFVTVIWASLILLCLGLLTIGSQALRASKRNPVESLRSE